LAARGRTGASHVYGVRYIVVVSAVQAPSHAAPAPKVVPIGEAAGRGGGAGGARAAVREERSKMNGPTN